MSWKGILRRAGVNLTGPDGSNDWNFEGIVNARNIVSRFAGQHFHVDSNHANASDASGYGKRKDKPYATINYAQTQCTANNADVIWTHAGHVEAVIEAGGLGYDTEGITIVFLGNGDEQAKITFGTDVAADMDIDADNITLINPRFEAAIDALTGPIDINKANFTIIRGEYYDAAGKATTDCIVATAVAKGLTIDGWKYYESTTGTQKESNIQLEGVDDLILRNIDIRGDFDSGNIENVIDECLNVRFDEIYLDNLAPGPVAAMTLDENCDGFAVNVACRVASGTTYLSDNSDINWGADCIGFSADGGSGEPLGTSLAGGIEGKIDVIDEYHDVPAANNVLNAQINEVIGNKTDAGATDAVTETDTLVGYIKQLVTAAIADAAAMVIVDEFHDVPVKDNILNAQINEVLGNKEDTTAADAVTETDTIVGYIKQLVAGGIARDGVIGALNTAAAADAVTDTDLIMAYIKQLVTLAIARDTAIGLIDEFHDVPAANNILNAQINEVIGNKSDTTAAGAVTATDTLVAYIKQLVAGGIARDTALGVVDDLHDVPVADAVTNLYARDVIGIKTDTAINVVTTTKTLMAYLKGVLNEITIPTADNTDNAFINDVVGQKTDAAAADAVTATDTLVGYIKQLVTLAIARDTAIGTIDDLHDVPVANAVTNLYMRDVVGIKTDAAAADAVSNTESLMAYVKQAVTLAIARDTAIGIIDEFHDVPAADNVLNAQINEVIGNKSDAAAADAVTATDTLVGYIKQLVTAAVDGVVLGADAITAAKIGDAAFSDEHFDVDATGKLVAGTIVTKATGAIAGVGDTNLFTVANGLVMITSLTGEVTAQIGADQDHTLKHGTTDLAALLACDADAVGTLYAITGNPGDVLVEGNNAGAKGQVTPIIVNAGTIKLTVAGATFAGEITWRLNYVPLEAGATVTTA